MRREVEERGVRLVVGVWDDSPLGAFADVMVERADGHRLLLAPSHEVADFVTGTYTYRDATGTHPGSARVVFVSLSRDIAADAEVTLPAKLAATLDADGQIPAGFELPTLVDTARGIDGVYYQVKEDFPGGRALYDIFVASDATSIDMATVAPVVQVDELVDTRGPQVVGVVDLQDRVLLDDTKQQQDTEC